MDIALAIFRAQLSKRKHIVNDMKIFGWIHNVLQSTTATTEEVCCVFNSIMWVTIFSVKLGENKKAKQRKSSSVVILCVTVAVVFIRRKCNYDKFRFSVFSPLSLNYMYYTTQEDREEEQKKKIVLLHPFHLSFTLQSFWCSPKRERIVIVAIMHIITFARKSIPPSISGFITIHTKSTVIRPERTVLSKSNNTKTRKCCNQHVDQLQ